VHSAQERDLIEQALRATGWHRTRAARRLGIDRSTLWRKVREYGLEPGE
jgi:transcriptional regulator of acetoin/glycerol metabolism